MPYTDSIAALNTRSEVRGFLARKLNELVGSQAQQNLLAELPDFATGSDREVIESYRRFDKSYDSRSGSDAKYPRTAMNYQIRDLFAKALQRMKELPPDPRETLHLTPPVTSVGQKRRTL